MSGRGKTVAGETVFFFFCNTACALHSELPEVVDLVS